MIVLATTAIAACAEEVNDYPTSARAEYVFGCMKANGETRQIDRAMLMLDRRRGVAGALCSLASRPKPALSMSQVRGNLSAQFRTSEQANSATQ